MGKPTLTPENSFDKLDDPYTIGATVRMKQNRISDLDVVVYHQTQREDE